MRHVSMAAIIIAVLPVVATAQEKPVEPADMDWRLFSEWLRPGAEKLARLQREDGGWPKPGGAASVVGDEAGRAALASLALHGSARWMTGDASATVYAGRQKGLAFLAQRPPTADVGSASFALQVFYRADPRRYRARVDEWAAALMASPFTVEPGARSRTFLAAVGLRDAQRSGVQVPNAIWEKARAFLAAAQHTDGGWGPEGSARDAASTALETFEGATALYVVEDALQPAAWDEDSRPESAQLLRALDAAGKHVKGGYSPYGWFVLAQLARVTKRAELSGVDWRRLCVNELLPRLRDGKIDGADDLAFALLAFLQDRDSVDIGKLKRAGDWETRRNDVRGMTEFLNDRFSIPKDWRVVTLDADVETLLKVPILFINGRNSFAFTDVEKQKLRSYVDRGGTLWAEAVGASTAFDKSFRALAAELWPDAKLEALPREHAVFESPRPLKTFKRDILALKPAADGNRLGVFYFPQGNLGISWARVKDGPVPADAKPWLDAGCNVWFYIQRH